MNSLMEGEMWLDAWKPWQFIARQRLGKHISSEAKAQQQKSGVFCGPRHADMQRCRKHTSFILYVYIANLQSTSPYRK
jgi:hypothetical protein